MTRHDVLTDLKRQRAEVWTKWTDWLASTGYGVDYGSAPPPPCTLRDLAEAYHRAEPECSVDEWASCITANTGVFDDEGGAA